jgi:hypothetical protein
MKTSKKQKQLARWVYYEDAEYYCPSCMNIRLDEINRNKEFAEYIDYNRGEECGYFEDYIIDQDKAFCCKCSAPLFAKLDC